MGRTITGHMGSVVLDDCNFHECVNLKDFEAIKTLAINHPDGEFLVVNYRINGDFPAPLRIYPSLKYHHLNFRSRSNLEVAFHRIISQQELQLNSLYLVPQLA